ERLSQILFVYAREHPEIGYRQGMHEILSYVLLVLEMDLLQQATEDEKKRLMTESLSPMGMSRFGSEGKHLLHDAFNIFECIMMALAPAYDAIPVGDETTATLMEAAKIERGESPMEQMTSSIVSKIRYVARDEALFSHVLYMPVPPQLYFAKWVRLMFGREMAGGMKDVMRLWDAFFDLAWAASALDNQTEVSTSMALMNPDPNEGIGYLMNYPPVEDIGLLV
ncbi:small GTPase, partial [Thalassiosira pseudonana CCMP1335]